MRHIGLEAILMQKNSDIPKVIEDTFKVLSDEFDKKGLLDKNEIMPKYLLLSKFLSTRLNFPVDIVHSDYTLAYALFPYFNAGHILGSSTPPPQLTGDVSKLRDYLVHDKGKLDRKNIRVEGFFTKLPATIILNFNVMKDGLKLSIREMTAVTLHELGHAWNMMEYSDRMQSVNQVLAEALDESRPTKEKNEYILKLANENELISKAELNEIVSGKNKYVSSLAVMQTITKSIINITKSAYVSTTSEALADNFATKFGYGRELVSALHTMEARGNRSVMPSGGNAFAPGAEGYEMAILRILLKVVIFYVRVWLYVILGLGVLGLMPAPVIFAATGLYFIQLSNVAFLNNSSSDDSNFTQSASINEEYPDTEYPVYDTAKRRFQRIRNTILNELKNEPDARYVKQYVEQLDDIQRYIDAAVEHKTMWKWLKLTFSKRARTDDMQMREEQMLEDLVANDLYLAAAKLKLKYA